MGKKLARAAASPVPKKGGWVGAFRRHSAVAVTSDNDGGNYAGSSGHVDVLVLDPVGAPRALRGGSSDCDSDLVAL